MGDLSNKMVLKCDGQKTAKIITPNVGKYEDIKSEFKSEIGHVTLHSIYPDGFEILAEQYSTKIEIYTNTPLVDNGNGTYSYNLQ